MNKSGYIFVGLMALAMVSMTSSAFAGSAYSGDQTPQADYDQFIARCMVDEAGPGYEKESSTYIQQSMQYCQKKWREQQRKRAPAEEGDLDSYPTKRN